MAKYCWIMQNEKDGEFLLWTARVTPAACRVAFKSKEDELGLNCDSYVEKYVELEKGLL